MNTRITIDALVQTKIQFWVNQANTFEVSGFGKVVQKEDELFISDAFLCLQHNSMGETNLDPAALGKLFYEKRDLPGTFNFWWHSHGNGASYFSEQDRKQIEALGKNGWLIASVFNTNAEIATAFYAKTPFPIYFEDLSIESLSVMPATIEQAWREDYLKNIRYLPYKSKKKHIRNGQKDKYYFPLEENEGWSDAQEKDIKELTAHKSFDEWVDDLEAGNAW